jgi:NADH-ubiquinone oxidoreductase chain 4
MYSSLGCVLIWLYGYDILVGGLFYVCIFLAFLVKMPTFIVYLWPPKAWFEAPVSGCLILVCVLLKSDGYGFLLLLLFLYCLGLGLVMVLFGFFEFGWGSCCQFVLYMADWFEVTDCLFLCSSYEHGYWWYNTELLGESLDLLPWWWIMACVFLVFFCFSNIFYECFGRRSLLINRGIINLYVEWLCDGLCWVL